MLQSCVSVLCRPQEASAEASGRTMCCVHLETRLGSSSCGRLSLELSLSSGGGKEPDRGAHSQSMGAKVQRSLERGGRGGLPRGGGKQLLSLVSKQGVWCCPW